MSGRNRSYEFAGIWVSSAMLAGGIVLAAAVNTPWAWVLVAVPSFLVVALSAWALMNLGRSTSDAGAPIARPSPDDAI